MAKARLEIAVERLSEAEGSGKNGRDWLVKELSRVAQETHVLQAEILKRDEVVLEIHGQVIGMFFFTVFGGRIFSLERPIFSPWTTLAEPKSLACTRSTMYKRTSRISWMTHVCTQVYHFFLVVERYT